MALKSKSLSIFVLAGIVVLSSVAATIMLDDKQKQVTTIQDVDDVHNVPPPHPDDKIYDSDHVRSGVPILQATPMGFDQPREHHEYNQIDMKNADDFIKRVVEKGATIVSLSELESYFVDYKTNSGSKFEILNEDGSKSYMRIQFKEPKLDLDNHYVKAFVFSDEYNIHNSRALTSTETQKVDRFVDNDFLWITTSESDAIEVRNIIEQKGKTVRVNDKDVQLMYLGTASEELQIPEIRAMYPSEADGIE